MIITIGLGNWMSFLDYTEFSMMATREQHFGNRLTRIKRVQRRLLPIAALFGGNASGKTNFCKALDFAKWFITHGHQLSVGAKIPLKPFALNNNSKITPTVMAFTILAEGEIYEYRFELDSIRVVKETLRRITSPKDDFFFKREHVADGVYRLELGKAFRKDCSVKKAVPVEYCSVSEADLPEVKFTLEDRLRLISTMTRQNQLFLTSTVLQNLDIFKPIFDWFDKTLTIITPASVYHHMERYADVNDADFETLKYFLNIFDTGIVEFHRKEIPIEAAPFPKDFLGDMYASLTEGGMVKFKTDKDFFLFSLNDGKLKVEKLVPCHLSLSGNECIEFDFADESDGTNRLLELLPALIALRDKTESKVVIIDEVDRCLHPKATRRFLMEFLSACTSDNHSQLIITTHDLLLMDTDILRRDEMWAFERTPSGGSTIFSIADYRDARKDSDVRKSYLLGRMGGIPFIGDIIL